MGGGAEQRMTLVTTAATRGQREGRFPEDEALEDRVMAELASLEWRAARGRRVLVSPELRAKMGADGLGLGEAEVAEELRECGFGRWSGRGLEEIAGEEPEALGEWLEDVGSAAHGGESFTGLVGRVWGWMERQKEDGEACVVVTHASVVRAAVLGALGAPVEAFLRVEVGPLTATELMLRRGVWGLRAVGVPLRS